MEALDHYEVLGVNREMSGEGIRTAYLKLAKKYHPDINNGNKQCEEKFKSINMAYQVLSNPIKRKKYDEYCITSKNNNPRSKGSTQHHTQYTRTNYQSAEQRAKYYESGPGRQNSNTVNGSGQSKSTYSQAFKYDYQNYDYQSAEERAKKYESAGSTTGGSDGFKSESAKQSGTSNGHKTNTGQDLVQLLIFMIPKGKARNMIVTIETKHQI
ncbi:MAG: J domain-containing protein [Anaerolineaceae bacterium]